MDLYRRGEQWEYTTGELAQLATYQEDYLERDSWWEAIASFISDKPMISTANILQSAIKLDLDKVNNGHQRRVGRVMRALGWENGSRKINGKSTRVWIRTESADSINDEAGDF